MIRTRILFALASMALGIGCTTTEQEVAEQIEVLAANQIDSERWNHAVDELVAIGRPAARQLIVLLDPAKYKGKDYREFRAEIEQTRTGATVVLGRIKHKAASAQIHPRTAAGTYTFAERVASLRAVGELGYNQPAVTALKALFEAEADPVIRLYTAMALVKMNEASGAGEVHAALSADADPTLAKIAIEELRRTNYFGVPLLVELLASDSPYREEISSALSVVEERLLLQLDSDDPEIRMHSAQALGNVGNPEAISALSRLLDDPSNLVRFNAAASMSRLGDEGGTDFLFASMGSDDPILRVNAVKSLIEVQRSSGAVEERLIATLSDDEQLARSGAAQVLGQARVLAAVPQLRDAVSDSSPEVRYNAVIALGRIATPEAREQLASLVDDDDATVAYYAEWALRQLGGSS